TIKKPLSYYVPADRFGAVEGIWDLEGKSLYTLADRKVRETEPQAPVVPTGPAGKGLGKKGMGPPPDPDKPQPVSAPADPDGKRDLGWRPDGAGMSFLQLDTVRANDEKKTPGDNKVADREQAPDEKKVSGDKKPPRDRVMQWLPPFGKDDVQVVYETAHR